MASAFSHAAVAAAIGQGFRPDVMAARWLLAGMASSIVPDLDVLGYVAGIQYGDLWGHRGMTHSLLFAIAWGVGLAAVLAKGSSITTRASLALYLVLCTASHGLLDALTDGGLGVAFFSPFDTTRYFFPVRPVAVSPIGLREFFGEWGWHVLASEARWIWLPAALLAVGLRRVRMGGRGYRSSSVRQRP